jgi:hypothetical protein
MRVDQKMKSVFFYGLFMDEDLLQEKGLNPSAAIIAYVTGYGLRIGERATLMQSSQERSYGSVIQLDEEEIEILYSDKSVEDYVPEEVTAINTNGSRLTAVSYILPISKLSGQNREYAKSLAVVARKIGLPAQYIDEIEKWT